MVKTKNVSFGDLMMDALKETPNYHSDLYHDDYWYVPAESRETSLMAESIKRGALYLAKKAA